MAWKMKTTNEQHKAARAAHVSAVTFITACLSSLVPPLSPLSCLSTIKAKSPKTNLYKSFSHAVIVLCVTSPILFK